MFDDLFGGFFDFDGDGQTDFAEEVTGYAILDDMMSEEGDAILATPHSASEFNLTGNDVDLLSTPSYTFSAMADNYASRFRLVFSANSIDDNNAEPDNDFAFISNGELIINGTGTFQVIDMLGRQLFSREANSELTSSNASHFRLQTSDFFISGVYVLRLVNGENIKTQKIVIR